MRPERTQGVRDRGPGNSIEARATFGAAPFTHLGVATDLNGTPSSDWALFSTGGTTDTLFARTMLNGVDSAVSLGTGFVGAPHVYRITWSAGGVQFFINGTPFALNASSIPTPMAAQASEFGVGGPSLSLDWYQALAYSTAGGTFVSSAIDAGAAVNFTKLGWTATAPAGTGVSFETRTSSGGVAWSSWQPVASSGAAIASPAGRFIKCRATFSTTDTQQTAVVLDVTVSYTSTLVIAGWSPGSAVWQPSWPASPGADSALSGGVGPAPADVGGVREMLA